jgi:hypothetical protein
MEFRVAEYNRVGISPERPYESKMEDHDGSLGHRKANIWRRPVLLLHAYLDDKSMRYISTSINNK